MLPLSCSHTSAYGISCYYVGPREPMSNPPEKQEYTWYIAHANSCECGRSRQQDGDKLPMPLNCSFSLGWDPQPLSPVSGAGTV